MSGGTDIWPLAPLEGIAALGVPLLLGAGILRAAGLSRKRHAWMWASALFPAGATALAIVLFACMAVGVSVRTPVPGMIAAGIGLALFVFPREKNVGTPSSLPRHSKAARFASAPLVLLCLATVAFVVAGAARKPIHRDDDALIWGMKAHFLHHHEVFDDALQATMADATRGGHHLDYPLLNPLLQVWVTTVAGEHDAALVRWPTFLWFLSFTLLLLSTTRRHCGPVTGTLLSAALIGAGVTWVIADGAKSDLITALALLGLLDAAVARLRGEGEHATALVALFAAVLVWSKNEGLMLGVVALIATWMTAPRGFLRGLGRPAALWFLAPLAVVVGQMWFNTRFELVNDLLTGGEGSDERSLTTMLLENFGPRFGTIARAYAGNMAFVLADSGEVVHRFGYHNGLYLAFILLAVLAPKAALSGATRLVTLTCFGGLAAYFLVYVISYQDLDWHLFTSLPRVQSHLLPAMVLGLAMILGGLRRDNSSGISGEVDRS